MRNLSLWSLAVLGAVAVLPAQRPGRGEVVDTENIAKFEMESALLSEFWGRPIVMRAGVVIPPDRDPEARLPVCYNIHGFGGDYRGAWRGGPRLLESMANGDYPRMLYVYLDGSCPQGHHEFADSVNNGPWGEALLTELIPAVEAKFGADGTPTGRFLTGHSSGGWSSLWLQITYPDFFDGTWSTAPDPVDFRDFTGINVYEDDNAYVDAEGNPRQLVRRNGEWIMTIQQYAEREFARKAYGGQLASFDYVFSPRADDGRPMSLFDPETGALDRAVGMSWEKYDIRLILERHWDRLGPKLAGKVRIYCGLEDTFGLERAVLLLQQEMEKFDHDFEFVLVPGRDHGSLYQSHDEHWPRGMMDRIHREMAARYASTR